MVQSVFWRDEGNFIETLKSGKQIDNSFKQNTNRKPEYLRKSQAERERAERESVKHADVVKKQENGEKSE